MTTAASRVEVAKQWFDRRIIAGFQPYSNIPRMTFRFRNVSATARHETEFVLGKFNIERELLSCPADVRIAKADVSSPVKLFAALNKQLGWICIGDPDEAYENNRLAYSGKKGYSLLSLIARNEDRALSPEEIIKAANGWSRKEGNWMRAVDWKPYRTTLYRFLFEPAARGQETGHGVDHTVHTSRERSDWKYPMVTYTMKVHIPGNASLALVSDKLIRFAMEACKLGRYEHGDMVYYAGKSLLLHILEANERAVKPVE